MIGDLSENFHVSLSTATCCICLLKSQNKSYNVVQNKFNIFVSDLSVVKNLIRFCFSVPYALCREKNNKLYIYIYIYIYIYTFALQTLVVTVIWDT